MQLRGSIIVHSIISLLLCLLVVFVILLNSREQGGNASLVFGVYDTPEHRAMRTSMGKFIDQEINPHVDKWENARRFPAHELFKKMGTLGFLGVNRPVSVCDDCLFDVVLVLETSLCVLWLSNWSRGC